MPLLGLPGLCPVSSHFTHFPYATGTTPAAVLVVVPRVGGFACILAVSSTTPNPTGFTARSYAALFFLALEPWAAQSGLWMGSLAPKVSP